MAAEVPGIIFIFKGGRREKEHSQKVCFQTDLSFGVEREVLQWIYHCFALVGPGSHAHLRAGEGTSHRIKEYPWSPELKLGILSAWKKEGNGNGMGDGGEELCHRVLINAVLLARNRN